MKKMILFLLLCYNINGFSAEIYPFDNPEKRQQFQSLTRQFRCLVCQNQDLASSNAGLANDLRQQIYELVNQGQNNQQIKRYMEDRYGEFVLFSPPWRWQNALLWLGPFAFLLIGILAVIIRVKQARCDQL